MAKPMHRSMRRCTLPLAMKLVQAGAMMLFGEKYPDPVRMVSMGSFSKELCGGTHLERTGDVEAIELVAEEGVSAGTRRIVALTGPRAKEYASQTCSAAEEAVQLLDVSVAGLVSGVTELSRQVRDLKKQVSSGTKAKAAEKQASQAKQSSESLSYADTKSLLRESARILNVGPFDVPDRVRSLQVEVAKLKEQLETLAGSEALSADALLAEAMDAGDTKIVVAETPGANPNLMRQLIDQLRNKSKSLAVMLLTAQGDKVILVASISDNLIERGLSAGQWVKDVAPVVGGGGGGKANMAQAGGKNPAKIPEAVQQAKTTVSEWLS